MRLMIAYLALIFALLYHITPFILIGIFDVIHKDNKIEFMNYCCYRSIGYAILSGVLFILNEIVKQNKILTEDETNTN